MKAIICSVALIASVSAASAHSWYDADCCNLQDCEPIARSTVTLIPGFGYEVTLRPGEHFKVTEGEPAVTRRFTFEEARPSADADFHACVFGQRILCLYEPMGGM